MLPGNHLNPLLKAWQLLLLTPNCNVISLLHVCHKITIYFYTLLRKYVSDL